MHYFDLATLEKLVNINSQSQNITGVTLAQKYIAHRLSSLGMNISWHKNHSAQSADALVATYGQGPLIVTLLGHSDTVARGGEYFPFEVKKNNLITGAGIADMKAGVAIIIESLCKVIPIISDEVTLRVVISPNEEVGSPGFHGLFSELGKDSDIVLCFEPALEDGSFIHARNGNRWYDLNLAGEKFHTGRAVKGSPNILHQLCELYGILDRSFSGMDGIKFNFSSFSCDNQKFNVSSSEANAKVDVRFSTTGLRDRFHRVLEKWSLQDTVSLQLTITDDCPPLENNFGDDLLKDMKAKLERREGERVDFKHCEGASDANYFSHADNIVLDGLGARGYHFHSRKEFIEADSLEKRTAALVDFLLNVSRLHASSAKEAIIA